MHECSAPKQRAQGKPGARCTRSRACRIGSTRVSHHRFTGTPGLPCAMVLAAYLELSPVTGLSCHRRYADRSANLTPASGCQDHTTLPSADKRLRQRAAYVHRIPHPTSVTIAIRPSYGCGMATDVEVIWVKRTPEYFCEGGWTCDSAICPTCIDRLSDHEGRLTVHRLDAPRHSA